MGVRTNTLVISVAMYSSKIINRNGGISGEVGKLRKNRARFLHPRIGRINAIDRTARDNIEDVKILS